MSRGETIEKGNPEDVSVYHKGLIIGIDHKDVFRVLVDKCKISKILKIICLP